MHVIQGAVGVLFVTIWRTHFFFLFFAYIYITLLLPHTHVHIHLYSGVIPSCIQLSYTHLPVWAVMDSQLQTSDKVDILLSSLLFFLSPLFLFLSFFFFFFFSWLKQSKVVLFSLSYKMISWLIVVM